MSLLELEGVTVRFGGQTAVNDVSLSVAPGIVTGLIGPNGAGKTTTFNVISGLQDPVSGTVRFDGRSINRLSPHKRARLGIARTFQRLELFGSLTARENLLTAAEFHRTWGNPTEKPADTVDRIVELLGIAAVIDVRADQLPTGQARLVELGRALAVEPKLLLLDEPASGLDDQETGPFANLLTQVAASGIAVLLVEHDMALVMRVCQQIAVLDFGSIIATGDPVAIRSNPLVLEAYLGADT